MTGLGAGVTETAVGSLLTLGEGVALDLGDGGLDGGVDDGEGSTDVLGDTLTGLGGLDLLSGRVELLELTALAGEEDQASLVVLQAGDVLDKGLLGVVGAAVVNGDTDGTGELLGDTGLLNWGKKKMSERCVLAIPLVEGPNVPIANKFGFTFSSARVKPRPARTRRLYLMVGHRTTGRSLSTGRGATAAALAIRASRRRCLRPG